MVVVVVAVVAAAVEVYALATRTSQTLAVEVQGLTQDSRIIEMPWMLQLRSLQASVTFVLVAFSAKALSASETQRSLQRPQSFVGERLLFGSLKRQTL